MSHQNELPSRREFLRRTGLLLGGAGLGSLALTASCGGAKVTAPVTTSQALPPITSAITGTLTTPSLTKSALAGWPPDTATLTPPPAGGYTPPDSVPELLSVAGSSAVVAADRYYSFEHIWVKPLGGGQMVMGMSEKLVTMQGGEKLAIVEVTCSAGESIARGAGFAQTEGYKLNMDLISPLSGKVLQTNEVTPALVQLFPYTAGWLLVILMSKLEEMADLFGPRYYAYMSSPEPSGSIPDEGE